MTDSNNNFYENNVSLAVLIPAAGAGTRLGKGPKGFMKLGGLSLLARAVQTFSQVATTIYFAVPEVNVPTIKNSLKRSLEAKKIANNMPDIEIVAGDSQTRQRTVAKLVAACKEEHVLIHDVARPFLPPEVITRVQNAVTTFGAACAALPMADSLLNTKDQTVIDRQYVAAIQTPQGFRRDLIEAAHINAQKYNFTATDDAALVRQLGHEVVLVEGSKWLFKITTESDFELAEAVVNYWDNGQLAESK